MSLAFVSNPKLLALELQALESSGVGEVISEPRIVTTNRRAATIRQDQVSQLMTAQGPAIETRELNTRVTVDQEETLVLAGVYESREENVLVGIPGFSSIPILEQAFQSTQRRAFKLELLIFITRRAL